VLNIEAKNVDRINGGLIATAVTYLVLILIIFLMSLWRSFIEAAHDATGGVRTDRACPHVAGSQGPERRSRLQLTHPWVGCLYASAGKCSFANRAGASLSKVGAAARKRTARSQRRHRTRAHVGRRYTRPRSSLSPPLQDANFTQLLPQNTANTRQVSSRAAL
jgi:hypothetical protein